MVVGHQYISPTMTCLRHVTLHFFVVQFLFIVCLAYSLPFAPSSQMAPASLSRLGRSPFLACRSELPPMCFFAMKMLGTVDWPVRSARADWIAEPSSTKRQSLLILQLPNSDARNNIDRVHAALRSSRNKYTYRLGPAQWHRTLRPCRSAAASPGGSRGSMISRRRRRGSRR